MLMTNGVMDTTLLNSQTARELRSCKSVSICHECGWHIALGKDESGNIIVAVHAHEREHIEMALMSEKEKRQKKKEIREQLNSRDLSWEQRRELSKKMIFGDYDYG